MQGGHGNRRPKGDSDLSRPGTSKMVLWVPWRSPQERGRLNRQDSGPLPASTTELCFLTLQVGSICDEGSAVYQSLRVLCSTPFIFTDEASKFAPSLTHSTFVHASIHSFTNINQTPDIYGRCSAAAGEALECERQWPVRVSV